MLPAQPNQALIDGLSVLQELAVSEQAIGSREMGRRLGIEATRANRLLRTLAHLGMASQTADRKYVPGPAMHVLSAQSLFGSGLIRTSLPVLTALGKLNMTVAMGVLWRDSVCYLYHAIEGVSGAAAVGRVGLYPATRSGIGLALLAQETEQAIRALYDDRQIPGFGSIDELVDCLVSVRVKGWAYTVVDSAGGKFTASLGVPVGEPAHSAIALSGDIREDRIEEFLAPLQMAANDIERESAFGGR